MKTNHPNKMSFFRFQINNGKPWLPRHKNTMNQWILDVFFSDGPHGNLHIGTPYWIKPRAAGMGDLCCQQSSSWPCYGGGFLFLAGNRNWGNWNEVPKIPAILVGWFRNLVKNQLRLVIYHSLFHYCLGFYHHPRWLFGISEPSTVSSVSLILTDFR